MTDDLAGGASAPAEQSVAPEITEVAQAEPTPRGAIDRAFDALDAQEDGAPETAPAETKAERPRNPDGTFAAKEGEPDKPDVEPEAQPDRTPGIAEPPSRFSADAKAAWATVPDNVKGEVHRALREAEQGIEKYKANATRYEQAWKPFEDMAAASRLDPIATLKGYVQIDQLLAQDFDQGIAHIFERAGADLKAWAAQVAGQQPQPQDQVISELRREIAELRQGYQGVAQTVDQTRQQHIGQSLDAFMGTLPEPDRALFNELDAEIAAELRDPGVTLAEAFSRAKQNAEAKYTRMFGPRPSPAAAAPQTREPDPAAQTRKGHLSVTGAPGSGSNPDARKPPSSARQALDGAFAAVGL